MFSQHTCNIMWILFNWEKELILHFTLYRNISIAKYFQMPNFPQIFTFYEVGHLRKMDGGIKCYWIPSFVCVTKTKLSTNNNQRKIFFCFFFSVSDCKISSFMKNILPHSSKIFYDTRPLRLWWGHLCEETKSKQYILFKQIIQCNADKFILSN